MNRSVHISPGTPLVAVTLAVLSALAACEQQPAAPTLENAPPSFASEESPAPPETGLFGTNFGLYEIDPASGATTAVGTSIGVRAGGAATAPDGTLYGVELTLDTEKLVTINTSTGVGTEVGTLSYDIDRIGSIVFDDSGTLWGTDLSDRLFQIDPGTGAVSNVRTLSTSAPLSKHSTGIQGMGFVDGKLYGCCGRASFDEPRQLVEIDLATATVTAVGTLDLWEGSSEWVPQSMAVSPSGTLLGWSNFTTSRLATIDPVTGKATLVDPETSSSQVLAGLAFAPLAPPNASPVADAGESYAGYEGSAVVFDGTGSSDPDGDVLTFTWTFGDGSSATGATPSHVYADDGSYEAELTVEDPDGATDNNPAAVEISNVAPEVTSVSGPTDPVATGTSVSVSASFTDPGILDSHTASVNWGDGAVTPATVSGSGGSGEISASHVYATAGVYTITVTVTDDDGGSDSGVHEYGVVYDPDAGFVTGGGWIDSPTGAYRPDPSAVGKATFGFVSRYRKGANTPTGNTQFRFESAGLKFHSSDYEWLVVAGPRAQYKGTGSLNGEAGYGFMIVAVDGDASGGGGTDRFRIKIWDTASDEIVYDNQPGESTDSDATTALGGGSVVIHGG